MKRLLVLDKLEQEAIDILKQHFEADVKTGLAEEEIVKIIGPYEAIVVRSATKVTPRIIDMAHNLKLIGRSGAGVDNIDVPHATKHKIAVMNTPSSNSLAVAELVLGLMLDLSRNISAANYSTKSGKWEKARFLGTELHAKTLGIIGFGRIGREVAMRAIPFGMHVHAFDAFVDWTNMHTLGAAKAGLSDVMACDFVTVHAPLLPDTRNMVGRHQIALMKPTAFLINCARGGIVDEAALYDALKEKRIKGAAIDVFVTEPPAGNKLLTLDNVIATPHIGGSSVEAQVRCGTDLARQMHDWFEGRPKNVVNP